MPRRWVSLVPRRRTLADALREALVGLVFAIMVAPLIFCIGGRGQLTSDWSQRLHFVLDATGGALGPGETPRSDLPRSWYFVDLNGDFCQSDASVRRCPPDVAQTDHKALGRLLENILAQHPRLVIVDILLAKSPVAADDRALLAALGKTSTPVLLSWAPREGSLNAPTLEAQGDDLLFSLDPANALPNVRYLPAVKSMDGPTTRYLSSYRSVSLANRLINLPTIAYGAALILASPRAHPFARLDRFDKVAVAPECGIAEVGPCSDYDQTQRIFSFPRRAPHEEVDYVGTHDDPFYARIDRVAAPRVGAASAERRLKDAVVVIGNSDFAAGDQAWSALGDVSGAELIINDVRQYLVSPPHAQSGFWSQFVDALSEEIGFYLLSAVAIFVTEAIVDLRWPLHAAGAEHDDAGFTFRHLLRALAKLFIEILLSFLSYGAMISFWRHPIVDFVSPFFGSLVQAIIESLYHIKKCLDAFALWLFRKAGLVRGARPAATGD